MNHCSGTTRRRSSQSLTDHVGGRDLLDAAPFALDHEHVVDADRLGHRDLQAGQQIAETERAAMPTTSPTTPGRGEQARADWRARGKVIRTKARPADQHRAVVAIRASTRAWVVDPARLEVVDEIRRIERAITPSAIPWHRGEREPGIPRR